MSTLAPLSIWPAQTTYDHLLRLARDAHPLDHLQVLHAGQDLVLDLEAHRHAECGALLNVERLVLERFELPRLAEIDDDVGSALDLVAPC